MATIRIFISSPGDVLEERAKARQVIDQLQRHYGGMVQLLPVLWEDLPLQADASFQEGIDTVLSEQHRIDIAVFILWSRLGSALGGITRKPDGSPYRSGTEREFNLMLAAREQSGTGLPHILAYVRQDDQGFKHRLNESSADQLENIVTQRKLLEEFIREQFQDEEGRNMRAYHSYPMPVSFAQRLRVHLKGLLDGLQGTLAGGGSAKWDGEPYRGLEIFDVEHADIFQGREEEVFALEEILRRRAADPCDAFACAIIVGASGSGKSSLARAGVASSLTRYNLDESVKEWRHAVLLPSAAGGALPAALVRSMASALPELNNGGVSLGEMAVELVKNAATTIKLSINPAFARESRKAGGPVRLLMIIDQMEELWTDRRITPEERERFFEILESLCAGSPVAVLATLRSDFYHQAQQSPAFLRLKGSIGQYDLLPPGPAALQNIISEPARLTGLRFEKDERTGRSLDQRLMEDALSQPDALPLLQYALRELYLQRNAAGLLTFAAYDQMGGVEGALGQRAEAAFAAMPPEAQACFSEVMHHLVTVNTGGDVRTLRLRSPLSRVADTASGKLFTETLIAQRFLTADREGDESVVCIAHEALLRRWKRLADWIAANRESLRLRARVEQSQTRWEQGKDPSLLLPPGLPLEEGRQLLKSAPELLNDSTRAYITASAEFHAAAGARKRRLRNMAMAAMSVLTLAAIAGGGIAWQARRVAEQNRKSAEEARGVAEQSRKSAVEALESEKALAKKMRDDANLITENITPLAYDAVINSSDYDIKDLANSFLVNTKGVFVPDYDPDSFKNSFNAALLCQLIANSEIESDTDLMTKTVKGEPLSEEEREKVKSSLFYATKMKEIISHLLSRPDLDQLLAQNKFNKAEFMAASKESLMAIGAGELGEGDYDSAARDLGEFVSYMEEWPAANDWEKKMRDLDLFEAGTNLSHALRLKGKQEEATAAMGKALASGELLAALDPSKARVLALRYLVADHYGELDAAQKALMSEHAQSLEMKQEDIDQINQLLGGKTGAGK